MGYQKALKSSGYLMVFDLVWLMGLSMVGLLWVLWKALKLSEYLKVFETGSETDLLKALML